MTRVLYVTEQLPAVIKYVLSVGECKQFVYIGFINPTQLCCGSSYAAADRVHEKSFVQVNVYLF
jgi:hypothetical protein